MATRSLFHNLRRINTSHTASWWMHISYRASPIDFAGESAPSSEKGHRNDDLKSRVLGLVFPRRSATIVLQNWVDEGHKVSIFELRRISTQLMKFQRYKHALEVLKRTHIHSWSVEAAINTFIIYLKVYLHNGFNDPSPVSNGPAVMCIKTKISLSTDLPPQTPHFTESSDSFAALSLSSPTRGV